MFTDLSLIPCETIIELAGSGAKCLAVLKWEIELNEIKLKGHNIPENDEGLPANAGSLNNDRIILIKNKNVPLNKRIIW